MTEDVSGGGTSRPTNEYVLNVAFVSFLLFTAVQFFFAILAKSESMMTDCAAMLVDVVTYLFNFMAEHMKHHHADISARELRLRRLYLELVPPLISVVTLIAVTVFALRQAFYTLVNRKNPSGTAPDLTIMLLFSALNLLLDIVNVTCFARVDQAIGLPGQLVTQHHHPHDHHHDHAPHDHDHEPPEKRMMNGGGASETTPLFRTTSDCSRDGSECNGEGRLNLNMCSAWTHVCADTLRSVAVLIAASVSCVFPEQLTATQADSDAAILVSVIILVSLVPLIQGLYHTACKIHTMWGEGREYSNWRDNRLRNESQSKMKPEI